MIEFFQKLFNSEGWPPRKICGDWSEGLITLHLISDAMIFLAYMAIPSLLAYFIIKNKTKFSWIIWLFVFFICLCGLTHLSNMIMFFNPMYRLDGVVKLATGVISLATVVALAWLVPRIVIVNEHLDLFVAESKKFLWVYLIFGTAVGTGIILLLLDIVNNLPALDIGHLLRGTAITITLVMFIKFVTQVSKIEKDAAQRQLLEADLRKTNAELEQFAYIASHDLKAPLRAISNLSEWVQEDLKGKDLSPDSVRYLGLIKDRIKRMNGLIEGILHYSRVGRVHVAKQAIDMNIVVHDILENIDKKNFTFKIGTLPTIKANPILIDQLMQNLLTNTVKHHERDDGNVEVTVKDKGSFWEFSVKDDGPGIPEAFRKKVFGVFQTYKPPTADSTGIGLALCKKIVEENGCEIWFESEPGKGTNFLWTWGK